MLNVFKQKVLKIATYILFGILILSFGIWGIGDHLPGARQAASQIVATVGDHDITRYEVGREVSQQIRRFRQLLGTEIDATQAREMGLLDAALENIVQRDLLTIGASDLGLLISDDVVRANIQSDERFRTPQGAFNRVAFDQALRSNGLTEAGYVALLRNTLLRQQYLSSLDAGEALPSTMVNQVYRYRNQRRVAEVVRLDNSAVRNVGAPDSAALQEFHRRNAARFTAPEYRALTLAELKTEDILDEIDVTDEAIEEEYQARIARYSTPARRELRQILVGDESKVRDAYTKLSLGEDFAKVAEEVAGLRPADTDLGLLSRDQVPLPELADAAFALDTGAVSQPIKTDLGWHIIRVGEVQEATVQPLSEVRDEVRRVLAEDKAVDELFGLANRFEDVLGGGASIEEAARQLNINVRKIGALSAAGTDPQGQPVAGIDSQGPILRAAFETEQGQESALNDLGENGYFILRVDRVTPPTLRPLDSIRDRVVAAWKDAARAKATRKRAEDLVARLKSGVTLAELSNLRGVEISETKPFLRTGHGLDKPLPGQLITELFGAGRGGVVTAAGDGAHYVARLKDVVAAVPSADRDGLSAVRGQIAGDIGADLTAQFTQALRQRHGVTVNRASLEQSYQQ
ncbi:MAG: SurA N-terminal domain-containing protein [Rhodospirillales bacterium]|nr:SurA N-terminal domain-containing protein [Rhodospirillales bacterium]